MLDLKDRRGFNGGSIEENGKVLLGKLDEIIFSVCVRKKQRRLELPRTAKEV